MILFQRLTGAALILLASASLGQSSQVDQQQKSSRKPLTVAAQITGWSLSNELTPAAHPISNNIILNSETRDIVLHFDSNLALAATQYRYRLKGYDSDWTVTQGTLAHYRQLPPGHFEFQVQARNIAADWGDTVASVSVIRRPFFYQTWYFYVLLILLLVLLTWQLLAQRDQLLKGQMGIVLEERNRIASDCHDTLMAGFAAVSWQLEATSRLFQEADATETPAAASCELARSMVAHCQSEARRIIWDLRDSEQLTDALSQALSRAIETHRLRSTIDVTFELIGEEIPIAPGAVHHLVCIGQEAVTNAIRHADATNIRVTLRYDAEALMLVIRDNGRGFHPGEAVTKPGHFGIPVMQERARKLGGSLRLTSNSHAGTDVVVTVDFKSIDRATKQQHYVVPWIGL